jgi:peptide/nickel transport system substrate-binding protein
VVVRFKIDKVVKRRWRRIFKRRVADVGEMGAKADDKIDRLLIRRFDSLVSVRRFVLLWILLFALLLFCVVIQLRALSPYYQKLVPVRGGMYSEGLIGNFTNANPLYATGTANSAISHLIFSGLFKYDTSNKLVGDLASGWQVDSSGKIYTVTLKKGLTWQDGTPLTSADVVFTYNTIQKPEAQSSLYTSWQGIKVSASNSYAVTFSLPNTLSSFPNALTNGIVPAHLLKKVPAQQLRSASFNTKPIGTGPFMWKFVEVTGNDSAQRQQRISLEPFNHYWAGKPKLDGFSILTFNDDQHLISAFKNKQINAMSGLETVPEELSRDKSIQTYTTPLTSEVMSFFNNSRPFLSDANIRRALVSGVDRQQIIPLLPYTVNPLIGPLLPGQIGYDPSVAQLAYNPTQANQLLDQAGWARGANGQRFKDGKPLTLSLSSQETEIYSRVAKFLQNQWGALGVRVIVHYYSSDDLQSVIIANHDYDILLYGINIGVDPDVFAYWDSSQAGVGSQGHLNLSEYKSTVADQALEAGRTRLDPAVRTVKYKAFATIWAQDAPTLALYQPRFLYIARGPVFGYERKAANGAVDRFYNVANWTIRQQHQNL